MGEVSHMTTCLVKSMLGPSHDKYDHCVQYEMNTVVTTILEELHVEHCWHPCRTQ